MSGATPTLDDIIGLLERRVRAHGASPLLTWYGTADERVELSATTVSTWADKIANLLDEEGLGEGDVVVAPLMAERPCHWVSPVWLLGCWQLGVRVVFDGSGALGVVGPGGSAEADVVVECSLHPLGLSDGAALGHLDFADVRLQPDVHQRRGWDPALAAELGEVIPRADRAVVTPGAPWPSLAAAIVAPLLGGGSTVLVEGATDAARLARVREAERAS